MLPRVISSRVVVRRMAVLAVAVSVALVTWSNDAYADQGPGDGGSSVDQYRERIPTSSGASATGQDARTAPARPLPRATATAIARQGGTDAVLLHRIAVSAAYGAPQHRLPPAEKVATASSAPSSAPVRALSHGVRGSTGEARIGGLLAALVALTGTLGLAARKRR
jgi:hypothetical protein